MKKLLIGLFIAGSAMAQDITQIPKEQNAMFAEARKIATRSPEQQKLDLAKFYEKYDLDISYNYGLVDLNYVRGVDCVIGHGQSEFTLINGETYHHRYGPESKQYWTRSYVKSGKQEKHANLLHRLEDGMNKFRLVGVCRGPEDASKWFGDTEDVRNLIDALIITRNRVVEKNSYYIDPKIPGHRRSWQNGSTIIMKYNF